MLQTSTLMQIERPILQTFRRPTGIIIFIQGRRGSGKTDFSLFIAETLAKHEVIQAFASNIQIDSSPFPIERITNLEDLKDWLESSRDRKLFILDEAGKAFRRRTPMSSQNITMLDHLQVIRHYRGNLIMCAPGSAFVDSASLGNDMLDVIVTKPYHKRPEVGIWQDVLERYDFKFRMIPKTTVRYDSFDVAPFSLKRPVEKPKFNDEQTQKLWDWSHGVSSVSLGLHKMQINRLARKFVREALESGVTSHN